MPKFVSFAQSHFLRVAAPCLSSRLMALITTLLLLLFLKIDRLKN